MVSLLVTGGFSLSRVCRGLLRVVRVGVCHGHAGIKVKFPLRNLFWTIAPVGYGIPAVRYLSAKNRLQQRNTLLLARLLFQVSSRRGDRARMEQ